MLQNIWKIMSSDIAIIVYEACLIVLLIIVLIRVIRKQAVKEELQGISRSKMRDDALKGALENDYAPEKLIEESTSNVPYEVKYHDSTKKNNDVVSIQLIEKSMLSERKYIFNVETLIRIGKHSQNEIVLNDTKAVLNDAQLIRQEKKIYVKKAMPISTLCLQRGKNVIPVGENPLEINSGDVLLIGETSIEIRLL